jgi:hypothetical protein
MEKLKQTLMILALTLFASTGLRSQNAAKTDAKPDYKVNLVDNKEVVIEFDTDRVLDNVLILIVDGSGNTLFLDNQKEFKGIYKCSVDLSMYAKGNYFVNIKSEGEQKQAKLTIK